MIQTKAELVYNKRLKGRYMRCMLYAPLMARKAGPGQFVNIKVSGDDVPLLRRPFSIHRVKGPNIEVIYELLGKGTELLSQRKAGEYLDVIGPLGNGFDYASCAMRHALCVLVAGGMGVAPLIFLTEKLMEGKSQKSKVKILVLLGAKTKNQILCENEFKKLGCEIKIATDDGSRGFEGKVTELLEEVLAPGSRLQAPGRKLVACSLQLAAIIYACGPRPMLKEISRVSKRYGIPAQVSLEEHIACGIGACLGCVVKTQDTLEYKRVCKDGPVFEASQIIWGKE
jgi:dihydroorotate dehydrogenase electron transfer subunit